MTLVTTSATFGHGKTTLLKTMAKSKEIQDLFDIVGGRGKSQAMRVLAYSVVCMKPMGRTPLLL